MTLTPEQLSFENHYLTLRRYLQSDSLTEEGRCWIEMEMAAMERSTEGRLLNSGKL